MSSHTISTSLLDSQGSNPSYSTNSRTDLIDFDRKNSLTNARPLMDIQASSNSPDFEQAPFQFFRRTNRLVSKEGFLQVKSTNVPNKTKLYLVDVFTTMIDMKWHWVILMFVLSYVISWMLFATVWWVIMLARGESVCFSEVDSWTSAFLFSVETQQTIGYGHRTITTKCAEAVIMLQLQSIVGILIDAFMLGLTFAKISRPRERARTVMFSKFATIAIRDGKMCLMFRVGDVRKSQIVEAHIRAQLFRKLDTSEGRSLPFYQQDLRLCYDWRNCERDDNRNQLFLMVPLVIIHIIDEFSPLYDISPSTLRKGHFEIIIVLDGIVEATGMNTQAKTSYLNEEILWGYEFSSLMNHHPHEVDIYAVDYARFDDIEKVEMPDCSPREYSAKKACDEGDPSVLGLPNEFI